MSRDFRKEDAFFTKDGLLVVYNLELLIVIFAKVWNETPANEINNLKGNDRHITNYFLTTWVSLFLSESSLSFHLFIIKELAILNYQNKIPKQSNEEEGPKL